MRKYLNISEAAEKLGISKETLRRWDKNGKFESVRHPVNNYRVYTEDQIKLFVKDYQENLFYRPSTSKINILPFFTTNFGNLYNCDAVHFLKSVETESVDLIFCDPPYNIKKAEWDSFSSQKQYVDWCMSWIIECHRILSPIGSLYICGFSEILADLKWAASHLFAGCKWLVWFYRNKANLGSDWGRSHESILHFRKTKNFIFNINEIRIPYNQHTLKYPKRTQAETSQYSNGKMKDYVWEPNPLGAKPKDVFEIPTISNGAWEKFDHETQKPVELLRKIILSSSNKDSIIIDPFGGSGTTYAVSEAYERKWYGSELNKKYCIVIKNRIDDVKHINRIRNEKDTHESVKRRVLLRG